MQGRVFYLDTQLAMNLQRGTGSRHSEDEASRACSPPTPPACSRFPIAWCIYVMSVKSAIASRSAITCLPCST